ncbi:MAG: Cof-type HAD-IIB family hydrolase [Anaerolineae bacterium]|nr:Cof-type HAD-IIB family hydrolase [Anaerolineae bacterium]
MNYKMPAYKLLVLDVDGTLIGPGVYPSPRVVKAIARAKAKGVTVVLGTGRASEACYHLLKHLGLDKVHIFFDGAAVVDWPSNDIIFLQSLPPHAGQHLIELARENDLFLEIYAHDFYFIERNGHLAAHQCEKLQITPLVTDLMSLVGRIKIVKGQLLASTPQEEQRARLVSQEMEKLCKMSWSLDPSNNIYFVNAISRSVSKGDSLRSVADYLGLCLNQVMAIGDSFNDLPVFEVAGFSVAMGNAPEELKKLADWVAPPVEKDGVAVAIEELIL